MRWLVVVILVVAVGASVSQSAASESADTLESKGLVSPFWEVHPSYEVTINKRKDVTNWGSKIGLRKRLSEKVTLTLNASLQTRENTTLNRSDANDATTALLNYNLNENISFSINYDATVNAHRRSLSGRGPVDRGKRQNITISSRLSKQLYKTIDVDVNMTTGSTENSQASVSNKGTRQNFTSSISYSPSDRFRVSARYTGKRLLVDSGVDSAGTSVFTSKDRTFTQDLSLSLDYEVISGIQLSVNASRSDDRRQHPDPGKKEQETERRSGKNAGLTSSFNLFKRFTWDLRVSLNRQDNRFAVQSRRNRRSDDAALNASAKILPWKGATVNLGGGREISRSEEMGADTGDNIQKSLTMKLSQDLGPKASLNLTALSDIVMTMYDDKEANPTDRDRLSNRASLDISYDPFKNVSTELGGQISREKFVYLKAARSANNRTTRNYMVRGSYNIKTVYAIDIGQKYDIGAVYTFYEFDDSKNTLVRNSNVSTSLKMPVTKHLNVSLGHNYKFQDQGSYTELGDHRAYSKSAETESHNFIIRCSYKIGKHLTFTFRQSYYVQENWQYQDGVRVLSYDTRTTEIGGKVGFKYSLGEKSKISLSAEQNRKEGTGVGEAFRKYWNIELKASHDF